MEKEKIEKEEFLLKLSSLEEEANKTQEQISLVNQNIQDFEILKTSIKNIEGNKDILTSLGKGVFIKTEIKEKELFVNVGAGVVLKKSPSETFSIIEKQIKNLKEVKEELIKEIEKINKNLLVLIEEAKKQNQV